MRIIKDKELLNMIKHTLNEIDGRLIDHGFRVACLLREMMKADGSYSEKEIRDMTMTAIFHDIGAYKTDEIDSMLGFETKQIWKHAIYGYLFLKHLSPLQILADAVLYHHVPWNEYEHYPVQYPKLTQMLSVADHCDIYLIRHEPFMDHIETAFPSHQYQKEIVDLMVSVLQKQDYVLEAVQKKWMHQFMDSLVFDDEEILGYIRLISFSIDFQSKHMVAHTITTTSISKTLAKLYHLSPIQIKKVEYGALLHDIGKVATPVSILEKPGKLNAEEMAIMRQHVVHSIHILQGAIDQEIVNIAVRHHEKLNGLGYPMGLCADDLSLEERLLAVADIFSALCGKRSYKNAFDRKQILTVLHQMAKEGAIDQDIVMTCDAHFNDIMETIKQDCVPILRSYQNIESEYEDFLRERNKR